MTAAMDGGSLGRLIADDRKLFRRLYQFNYCPAEYLHPSQRIRFVPHEHAHRLWEAPRARATLSIMILRQLKLSGRVRFDPTLPQWPLLLLDSQRLVRLSRYVAAAVLGPQVRKSVAREDVLRWKRTLTPELYKFSMTVANLLPTPSGEPVLAHGHPIEDLGLGWIDSALSGVPNELVLRTRLKYPASAAPLPVRTHKAKGLVSAVLLLLEQEWCSSFATKAA